MRFVILGLFLASLSGCDCKGALEGALNEAAEEAAQQASDQMAQAAAEAEGAASTNTVFTCNQVEQGHQCYHVAPIEALIPGNQSGCETTGTWTAGELCPTEGVIGTCTKELNNETRYYYEGAPASAIEGACTAFGGTFEAG